MIIGDLNAQVGHERVRKTFGAGEVNTNGKALIDFCVYYNL